MSWEHGPRCREIILMMFQEMVDEMAAVVDREQRGGFTITTFRVVAPPFDEAAFDCPHGTKYWIAPDAELQQWLLSMSDTELRLWQARQ